MPPEAPQSLHRPHLGRYNNPNPGYHYVALIVTFHPRFFMMIKTNVNS